MDSISFYTSILSVLPRFDDFVLGTTQARKLLGSALRISPVPSAQLSDKFVVAITMHVINHFCCFVNTRAYHSSPVLVLFISVCKELLD